ncbi:transcriptional regulator GutM [Enterococcus dongliensis]|uniref:Transcriptional regulator GutM n=1 Tax=Enterococcus dongliensis TaxID=2559925 RepID=A0AAP5KUV6_9ENTE|nr:transcriptional regulator GutM [Enterococcus dongliensis]MDT2596399.1 transcriptional regulator GutM [Enterococcus dongliensis]MDT2603755.1 transcriptional regulator GutM [Enterococcus dongliensis]MDT2634090.1 transcriptional regulator GutM [Enterococcus dongliensis]MDT2637020.1 transcriptional regulator GutM [Enterococcus dongliensis]MDT2640228.1 transcriptional regulator GutM [Enterococcus dongliensis]
MNIFFLGAIAIIAYILQIFLGMKQIKHFNSVYIRMKRKGKVAIGRRPGKITSGTILLLGVDSTGIIQEAEMMQGTSILARFKTRPQFIGIDIHQLTDSAMLVKENRLTRQAAANAQKIYLEVEQGNHQEERPVSPIFNFGNQLSLIKTSIQRKLTKKNTDSTIHNFSHEK